jgi:NADH-quinone oxidoreductase subunit M
MSFMDSVPFPILTAITFVPLAGALLLLFLNRQSKELLRWVALVAMLVDFVVSLFAYSLFDPSSAAMQLVEDHIWVRDWGSHKMGIDGISFSWFCDNAVGPQRSWHHGRI